MRKFAWMAMGILAVAVLTLVVPGCGGGAPAGNEGSAQGAEQPAQPEPAAPAAPESTAPETPMGPESAAPAASSEPMSSEPAAQTGTEAPAASSAPLTAETLVGTKWSAGGISFTFEKDGVLKVNDTVPGTWSLDGTTLKVGAMGEEYSATIEGGKIMYNGNPLEKVN